MYEFKVVTNEKFPHIQDEYYIEILNGIFEGVCFNFETLELSEEEEVVISDDGSDTEKYGKVHFNYHLVRNPTSLNILEEAEARSEFEEVIGEILRKILVDLFQDENTLKNEN